MSKIKVDEVSNTLDNGPVYFPYGVTGDASRMTLKPGITTLAPNQLATNVGLSTSIQIGFNQNMQFLGVGTITIREGSATGTIHESFTCGVSAGATITNNLLTLNLSTDLNVNSTYYVTLPNTGIANSLGATIEEVNNYQFQTVPSNFDASGGDVEFLLYDTGSPTNYYKYHIFANPGILTTTAPSQNAVDMSVLMVGGGGAGGSGVFGPPQAPSLPSYYDSATGGGGAGGLITFNGPTISLPSGNHEIYVGTGGTAVQYTSSPTQEHDYTQRKGSDTILTNPTQTITAYGGGYGGNWYPNGFDPQLVDVYGLPSTSDYDWGIPGGSGGGGGGDNPSTPTWGQEGTGTPGQGNPGAQQKGSRYNPNGSYQPGSGEVFVGGGGGGAGSSGQEGYYYPGGGPTTPQYYGRHGQGGNGVPVPAFPSAVLAPRFNTGDPSTYNRMGPTGTYFAGGGAGGGCISAPGTAPAFGNIGGYGGGGRTSNPWQTGSPPAPTMQQPTYTQDGSALLGGGGGGGAAHTSPPSPTVLDQSRGGNGGPGCFMIRYVYFSS